MAGVVNVIEVALCAVMVTATLSTFNEVTTFKTVPVIVLVCPPASEAVALSILVNVGPSTHCT